MRTDRSKERVEFRGGDDEGERLIVEYGNRGEPYREGVTLGLEPAYPSKHV